MKLLKSAPSLLLAFLLALLLSVPALALEDELQVEQKTTSAPVVVCTLDELLTAIELAENGGTIILQNKIAITENCIIGQEQKRITISPADGFTDDIMFEIWAWEEQDIVLQNVVLDGQEKSSLSAVEMNFWSAPNSKGNIYFANVQIENFISNQSTVYINATSANFVGCQILNNTGGRTGGVEIAPNATGKVFDCTFSGNVSLGNGGALCCRGQAKIEHTDITQNQAVNPDSARMGGGIYIDQQAFCEISDCCVTDNIAYLGGGIATFGEAVIIDTALCKNQGLNGASDVMVFSGAQLSLTYSDEMRSVYSENDPIGFYQDDMDNRFNPENNAVFLGESLFNDISGNQYGAKFIFSTDLPQGPPEESENSDEKEPPIEPPTKPQEPDTSDTSEVPEPDTSDSNEPPVIPVSPNEPDGNEPELPVTPDSSKDEDTAAPSISIKPTRPIIEKPSIVQQEEPSAQEETSKLVLSHGGVTIDTTIPLLLLGYGDGQLHENDPITRAQIVVLLYRSLTNDSKSPIADIIRFTDVANGAWYYDAVTVLTSAGIVNGCNGFFCPNDTLTYGQLIAMLTRFVVPKEAPMPDGLLYTRHWSYGNIVTAVAYGWIDNAAEIEPDRTLTRGEAVEIVNSIFEKI